VGRQPNEVAVTLDSTEAFVTNQNDTTVSVISIPHP
jgi:DNA-binding beta-propeller fold protein YncE